MSSSPRQSLTPRGVAFSDDSAQSFFGSGRSAKPTKKYSSEWVELTGLGQSSSSIPSMDQDAEDRPDISMSKTKSFTQQRLMRMVRSTIVVGAASASAAATHAEKHAATGGEDGKLGGLQSSMLLVLVQMYHAYFLFCSMIVGGTLVVHLLLTWFIDWLRQNAGHEEGYSDLPLGMYLAVFMRSWLLIRVSSTLIVTAAWLLGDALRLESFQVFRRCLCGDCLARMKDGSFNVMNELAEENWKYHETWQRWVDCSCQIVIYSIFDVYPVVAAIYEYAETSSGSLAWSAFVRAACRAACILVVIMYAAVAVSDVLVKWSSWAESDVWLEKRKTNMRASVRASAIQSSDERRARQSSRISVSALAPLESDIQSELPRGWGESERGDNSFCSDRDSNCSDDADSFRGGGRERVNTSLIIAELEAVGAPVSDGSSFVPMNLCALFCTCMKPLFSALIKVGLLCFILFLAYNRYREEGDWLALAIGVIFLLAVCLLNANVILDKWDKAISWTKSRLTSRDSEILRPRRRATTWQLEAGWRRSLRRFAVRVHPWSKDACGLEDAYATPQYDAIAATLLLQASLFGYINWYTGASCMLSSCTVVVLRRVTFRLLNPWGGLVAIIERCIFCVLGVALNGYLVGWQYALGTLGLAVTDQLTMSRQESKGWRARLWMLILFPSMLVSIAGLSFLAIGTGTGQDQGFSDLCHGDGEEGCRYLNTTLVTARATDKSSSALCTLQFDMPIKKDYDTQAEWLSFLDFAMLCKLSYESNATFERGLTSWFPGWHLTYQRRVEHNTAEELGQSGDFQFSHDWTSFFEVADPRNGTTVFVVRGTQTPLEMMLDLNMFAPVAICQLIALIAPILPRAVVEAASQLSAGFEGEYSPQSYYNVLLDHVRTRMESDPARKFYLTGHSLGGGIASLVSAETGVQAVTFSSPGTRTIREGAVRESGQPFVQNHDLLYTVVPDNDVVPMLDEQLGSEMHVPCPGTPADCHIVGNLVCTVLRKCGVPAGREVPCRVCPLYRDGFAECSGDDSRHEAFEFIVADSRECPAGFAAIADASLCESAASKLLIFGAQPLWSGARDWSGSQSGCIASYGEVWFNTANADPDAYNHVFFRVCQVLP